LDIQEYIKSGIIENYILGLCTDKEVSELKQLCSVHPEILEEIEKTEEALMKYAENKTSVPHPAIKPFLFATIDFTERMKNGEQPSAPPILNENSKKEDYKLWLDRADMILPDDFEEMHAKIIGYTPEAVTAIAWIKNMAPQEVHKDEYEKFFILEGSCDIVIGDKVHHLVAGDYLSMPLHVHHEVIVTSSIPCKLILQRVAA
jgi:mannose-6-phosphate isomerase-like protein (cupin superfamily)